ncbi:MAG: hypothetical protein M0C28_11940 [Candidatus Moduliflexus flocculans]|nr:hypothetical protein [Candidatus Moduliflexus flocculans]
MATWDTPQNPSGRLPPPRGRFRRRLRPQPPVPAAGIQGRAGPARLGLHPGRAGRAGRRVRVLLGSPP